MAKLKHFELYQDKQQRGCLLHFLIGNSRDYTWKAAEIEPWKLAIGRSDTWHKAHIALLYRQDADVIFIQEL